MSVSDHYDSVAADYYRQYQPDQLMSVEDYPANYFRLQILLRRMESSGVSSLYEVGVGEGTPLASMAEMGFQVAGCDISPAMVELAKATFETRGFDPELISAGDVASADFASGLGGQTFDAAMALGVLPHVPSDEEFLENIKAIVRPGGRVFIEFRNKLFSLFTFNRFTREFILDDLLKGVPDSVKAAVDAEISPRLALDLPPKRGGIDGAPGYDEILARYHNPFELCETFERNGFANPKVHWYHYHPALPKMERELGVDFRKAGFELEYEDSWRGMFLCSAGVIEAERL
jgi:2-polyprenyl-3-methyl-5-hydroxy-6-metoxy-1,4-benzoquinol methylase